MTNNINASKMVLTALEASIYVQPRDHGLAREELVEVGRSLGLREGEINEAIWAVTQGYVRLGERRIRLVSDVLEVGGLADFVLPTEPWPRNPNAIQFVHEYLRELGREVGRAYARVERGVLVAHGVSKALLEHDVEVAVTLMVVAGHLIEEDGFVRYTPGHEAWGLPDQQLAAQRYPPQPRPELRRIVPLVQDVIARRNDGRPAAAEPVAAFGAELGALGRADFSTWWRLTSSELVLASTVTMPTTVTVLSAALGEAALSFVVARAQKNDLTMNKGIDPSPRRWRFEALVRAARSGTAPILTQQEAEQCLALNEDRQRIHAARFLDPEHRGPIPDTKPEEARAAKATLDMLLRRILEWTRRGTGT